MTAKKENHSTSNTSTQISKMKPFTTAKLDNSNFQLNSPTLKTLQQSPNTLQSGQPFDSCNR